MRNLSTDWAPQNGGSWPPTRRDTIRYATAREGWEVVKWTLYDRVPYPTTGPLTLPLFARADPVNSNMRLGGMLPQGQEFLVQRVEWLYINANTTIASQTASGGSDTNRINQLYSLARDGVFNLSVGDKRYIENRPLITVPHATAFRVGGAFSDASTPTGAGLSYFRSPNLIGPPLDITPPFLLKEEERFQVLLSWPRGVQTFGTLRTVSVYLSGLLYRKSQ